MVDVGFGKHLKKARKTKTRVSVFWGNRQNRGVSSKVQGAIIAAHCALQRAPSSFLSGDRYRNSAAIFDEGICAERMPAGMMVAIVTYRVDSHIG